MNSQLAQTLPEGNHPQHFYESQTGFNFSHNEHIIETFFEEAKQNLLKDLVDFQNKDDFDIYMRSIEKNYYIQANVQKPPYEILPEFPPKPYQTYQKKQLQGANKKDFIDQVNDLNQKRLQTFTQNAFSQNAYMQQSNPYAAQYQTPFFDTVVNKENFMNSYTQPLPQQSLPLGMPYSAAPVPQGNIPQGFLGDKYGSVMEPQRMIQPPYLQKFVAGPVRLEQNPLTEPSRNLKPLNQSPLKSQDEQSNMDLKNPDNQYERYKQLMSSQYYNYHANSANAGTDMSGPRNVYMPQPPFQYPQQPSINPMMNYPNTGFQPPQNMFNMSFSPQMQQNPSIFPVQVQQSNTYSQTQQIYQRPLTISLYQNPQTAINMQQNPQMPLIRPDIYSSIKYQNNVTKDVIESIGGIQDTLRPMQETLKQHELRPYQEQKDYRKELYYSQHGRSLKKSNSDVKPENMHLVSVSPFRAVVKVKENKGGDDSDQEFQRQEFECEQVRPRSSLSTSRKSPIKNDSETIRGPKEEFLNTFSSRRNSGQSQRSNQKIKQQSEYMRSQREQFLNGFSSDCNYSKPPIHTALRSNGNAQTQI